MFTSKTAVIVNILTALLSLQLQFLQGWVLPGFNTFINFFVVVLAQVLFSLIVTLIPLAVVLPKCFFIRTFPDQSFHNNKVKLLPSRIQFAPVIQSCSRVSRPDKSVGLRALPGVSFVGLYLVGYQFPQVHFAFSIQKSAIDFQALTKVLKIPLLLRSERF